jgi:4-nitrophenyl phosphatase
MNRTTPTIGGYVFDIDGTLAMMDQKTKTYRPLPGAVEILDRVRVAGLGAVAYTNGTFHVPAHYYAQLATVGLPFAPGHILTPASVAAHHFAALGLKKILLIAAEGVRVPVETAGITTCAPGDPLTGVEAVLVGWQPDFSRKDLDAGLESPAP